VEYVGSLSQNVWRTLDITSYIALIKVKAQSRSVVALCDSVRAKAVDGDDPIALFEELQSSAMAEQLARRDANPNRRPTMQDLRESGNLEQDAHNVLHTASSSWCDVSGSGPNR
jgi:replicative DNA helicase